MSGTPSKCTACQHGTAPTGSRRRCRLVCVCRSFAHLRRLPKISVVVLPKHLRFRDRPAPVFQFAHPLMWADCSSLHDYFKSCYSFFALKQSLDCCNLVHGWPFFASASRLAMAGVPWTYTSRMFALIHSSFMPLNTPSDVAHWIPWSLNASKASSKVR